MSCSANASSPDSWLPPAAAHAGHCGVEDRRAGSKRLEEGRLLAHGDLADAADLVVELGVLRSHRQHGGVDEVDHRGLVGTEEAHHPDGAPHDATQHVAAALVAGDDAVTDEEHARAGVVSDDAQRHVVTLVGAVPGTAELACAVEDAASGVDLVEVVDALQDRRHALEAHAGVDVLGRQRLADVEVHLGPHGGELVLHEDEVPDLEVPVLVGLRAALAAVLRPAVVVDLRARATRTGHAHRPVVVLGAAALDAVEGQAHGAVPDVEGLVVVLVDRGPELLLGEAVATVGDRLREQLPGERDGALLEVVAEREVAGHLEERGMPRGLADLLDVEGADDLLHAGGARVRRRCLARGSTA